MPAFQYPDPDTLEIVASPAHTDAFGHVNNAVFIQWLEQCTWVQAERVGLSQDRCVALGRGLAIRRTEIDYLRPALAGDRLLVACWVIAINGLRVKRAYQIFRLADKAIIAAASIEFVSINLETGAPCRMPPEFAAGLERCTPGAWKKTGGPVRPSIPRG